MSDSEQEEINPFKKAQIAQQWKIYQQSATKHSVLNVSQSHILEKGKQLRCTVSLYALLLSSC